MSGIAGIIRFNGAPIEPGLIESMTSAMAHRGPDGIQHWKRGAVALGQCMLCTTPESLEEKQPLTNEDQSLVLVMDGRLDNWQELRRELSGRGAVLRDRSDAELALRAYEAWGRECLAHLDGDFALAIWDARRQRVFCARDRMGMKPFNYQWDGKMLTFASELHAILGMPWVSRELNEGMLVEYLSIDWLSRHETPWKGVQRLVQAHWLEAGPNGMQFGQYWRPDLHSPLSYRRDEEYAEHYRALFTDSVRRASRSDRPLACEVSGGLDSSAVFAVAASLSRQADFLAPALGGFTLRFEDDPEANELAFARAVAAHVGFPLHEVNGTHQPLSWYRDWARKYREFPGYPNGTMAWGLRSQASARGCRVLLIGVGGDEWLTGSRDYYAEEFAAGRLGNFLRCLASDIDTAGTKNALSWLARSCFRGLLPAAMLDALREWRAGKRAPSSLRRQWLMPRLREIASKRSRPFVAPSGRVAFGRAGQAHLYRTLVAPYDALARESEERLAASLGIELRCPLSCTAMVQFAFSTPERLRMQGDTTKVLHRRALAGLLPDIVLQRATKADFMGTFRRHGDDLRHAISSESFLPEREAWVHSSALQSTVARFGDPAQKGVPEWELWSWLGWRLLSAAPEALHGVS